MSEGNYYEVNDYGTKFNVRKFVFKGDMEDYILNYYGFEPLDDEEYDELMNTYCATPRTQTEEYARTIREHQIWRDCEGHGLVKKRV